MSTIVSPASPDEDEMSCPTIDSIAASSPAEVRRILRIMGCQLHQEAQRVSPSASRASPPDAIRLRKRSGIRNFAIDAATVNVDCT